MGELGWPVVAGRDADCNREPYTINPLNPTPTYPLETVKKPVSGYHGTSKDLRDVWRLKMRFWATMGGPFDDVGVAFKTSIATTSLQ